MARGFLGGALWGGVVCVGVAGSVSVFSGGPKPPVVADQAPGAVSVPSSEVQVSEAGIQDADLVQNTTPATQQPTPDTVTSVARTGADVLEQPETGDAAALETPDTTDTTGSVSVAVPAPVSPSLPGQEPTLPELEAELSISTDPAQPPAPQVPDVETAFAQPEAAQEPVEQAEITPTPEALAPETVTEAAPESEQDPVAETDPVTSEDAAQDPVVTTEIQPEAQPESPVQSTQEPDPGVALDTSPIPETPVLVPREEAGPVRTTLGRPAISLVDRDKKKTTVFEGQGQITVPPIKAFAADFTPEEGKPLMSIVLIDAGADLSGETVGLAALGSFPAPITFAVDASLPDAQDRMKRYRAEGFEVLAMIDLPEGATAGDAETNMSAVLNQMNEVVGVIEGVGTGIQSSREASDQVTSILAASGHGFVTQSNGLNTVQKLAVREGVPAANVFRDFDSAGQSPTVIRRFLDQAAFRANQEGGVIMLGRLRPDTISALLLWGLADRASRVNLAPVSAVLTREK